MNQFQKRALTKSNFKTGDIRSRFQFKDFRGIVNFSRDEEVLDNHIGSPRSSVGNLGNPETNFLFNTAKAQADLSRAVKRHRSWDDALAKQSKQML